MGQPAWSCGFHLDGDAKVVEALNEALGELLFVPLFEVVSTEVMVFDAVAEHEVGRGQHGAGDREDRLLGAAPALDAEELRAQVPVLLVRRGPRGIDQGGLEPR